jgi:hypothetical protein
LSYLQDKALFAALMSEVSSNKMRVGKTSEGSLHQLSSIDDNSAYFTAGFGFEQRGRPSLNTVTSS